MYLRTRLAVLVGAILFGTSMLAANSLAVADDDPPPPPWAQLCAGQAPTHFVVPGVPLFAGGGNDVILGTPWADEIHGEGGNDIICGLGDDDRISGGDGDDLVLGQGGDDDMVGNVGDDVLNGGPHNLGDRGNGGPGADGCPATEITISC